jgi:Zn-dependent peptidase ImmA (M78 family)
VDDLDPLHVDERGARARSVAEMRANAFAAHLLMPEPGGRTAIEGTADPDALGEILEEMAPGR